MPNKFITVLYNNTADDPIVANIPYSKEWMEKLTIANGAYINDDKTSPEQEDIINEFDERINIPPDEMGSWAKYVLKFGEEIHFNSVGCFILGSIY